MKAADIADYLIKLEREGFTGSVTLNFHKGDISKKVSKKTSEEVDEG